jgi:hypothetical protein
MFYEVAYPPAGAGAKRRRDLVVLTPAESRRLLAKAAVACPEFRHAHANGNVIIARGVTTAFICEELFGISLAVKANQTVGSVFHGLTNANTGAPPCIWHVIRKGRAVDNADSNVEILDFGPEDVFIKGANAVDPDGNAGIFASNPKGGTIGMCWPILTARASHLLMPVGLEKLVPSVPEASRHSGIFGFDRSTGLPVTVIPVTTGKVITEIQAFGLLAGVQAYHLGSGGIGGSEGAVILALEGDEARMKRAWDLVKAVKGEPPIKAPDAPLFGPSESREDDALSQLGRLVPEIRDRISGGRGPARS